MAKVMIVDDSPTEVHVLQTMLTKNGHDVVVATSGEEGVEMSKSEMPDLILMDVVMPGMNGRGLAESVREKYPDAKRNAAAKGGEDCQ